ncbi:MAG TPA: aminoacyl-tRNA hydrolase [Nitrospirota bacterium]|nr:aminoacyl-tRNA hydrolase [Nitrospirota bacterium]
MKIVVVGLGNPGRKYELTRHNAGFLAVDELARRLGIDISQEKSHSLIGRGRIEAGQIVLAKPQTYMNESGRAVAAVMEDAYVSSGDLIVIHDELDLPLGSVRIKTGGGHGGHNGLRSIIEFIGTSDFIRVRIGIGRPAPSLDAADYVLSPLLRDEKHVAAEAASRAADAVLAIASKGVTKAMNLFNQR